MAGIPFGVALLALWAASRARPPRGRHDPHGLPGPAAGAARLGRPQAGRGGLARILEGEGIPALDPFSPADLRRLAEALAGLSPPPGRGPIRLDL